MAILTEANIDVDKFLADFDESSTKLPSVIKEERPTHLPITPLPPRETIALEFFEGRPESAGKVRRWVKQKAKRWSSYGDWNGLLELLASEGISNGIRYGLPKRKASEPLPVEISHVREPSREGNLVVAFGDWRYNLLRQSVDKDGLRGLALAKELSVQTGFARPATLRGVDGSDSTPIISVPKAYWFEVGPKKIQPVTIYKVPQMREHH